MGCSRLDRHAHIQIQKLISQSALVELSQGRTKHLTIIERNGVFKLSLFIVSSSNALILQVILVSFTTFCILYYFAVQFYYSLNHILIISFDFSLSKFFIAPVFMNDSLFLINHGIYYLFVFYEKA